MAGLSRARGAALALLLVVLVALCIGFGTVEPDPERNHYPDEEHLATDYDAYIGERVEFAGIVTSVDPVVVETEYGVDGEFSLTVTNVDAIEPGDHVRVFGVVEPDRTVRAERAIVRAPWEVGYMYLVSLLAALWVGIRALRYWRIDVDARAVVARADPVTLGRNDG